MRKFNLRNLVAIVVYTVLITVLFTSCNEKTDCNYKLVATSYNGSGWNRSRHPIECDSVNMITIKKAEVFINGTKMIIKAEDRITVHSKCN